MVYVKDVLTGNFGISLNLYRDIPVASLVSSAAKLSFSFGLVAVILGMIIGMALGVFAALYRNTVWDSLATILSVLGVSIPSFVFMLLILILFESKIKILLTVYNSSQPVYSAIMPPAALSIGVIANVARFTRTEMIAVLNSSI